jgi:hypothetical protein
VGPQQEFLQLFLKNHYPLLKRQIETGRIVSVKVETPANHLPEDARWDYRVTIRFKNSTVATTANPQKEQMIKNNFDRTRQATRRRSSAGLRSS